MKLADSLKIAFGIAVCSILRLAAMPLPNIEPIMGFTLPYAKKYGQYAGFAFAFLALLSFDFVSGRLGLWTVYTALAYGLVGFLAAKYLQPLKASRKNFVLFAVGGTLLYDAVTALLFGWQFQQTLAVTLIGQIPFTLYHLAGNVALTAIISPYIYANFLQEPAVLPLVSPASKD